MFTIRNKKWKAVKMEILFIKYKLLRCDFSPCFPFMILLISALMALVLILRMFLKCESLSLFLSAVLMLCMQEKNCSQLYVLPHMLKSFLDKFRIS